MQGGTYEYYSCFTGWEDGAYRVLPYLPLENVAARDIKYLWSIGSKCWTAEVPPPDGVFGEPFNTLWVKENGISSFQAYYIVARLLWNPGLDSGKLKDDFYRKYYGAAAGPMRFYRELLSKSYRTAEGHFIYGDPAKNIGKFLVQPGWEQELLKYLSEAEKAAAGDSLIVERVARDKKYFSEIWQRKAVEWLKLKSVEAAKIKRREGQIIIDGNLNDPEWEAVVPVTGFVNVGTGQLAKIQTFVKILYDDKYVYFGVVSLEPAPDKLSAERTQRDADVWADDDVEIFVDPKGTGTPYYHFAVNSKGAIYDAKCASAGVYDTGWNADCKVACKILPGRWVLEMKIDAESLNGKITEGGIWKVNVGRNRTKEGGSSWAADGSFHQPASFRPVVFGSAAPLVLNGGFEQVSEMKELPVQKWVSGNTPVLFPVGWSLHGNSVGTLTIRKDDVHSEKQACQVEKGWITSYFDAKTGDTSHIYFWAKGEGLTLILFRSAGGGS